MIALICGLCLSAGLRADEAPFYEVHVDGVSSEVDANEFPPEFKRSNVEFKQPTSLPKVKARDEAFSKAGILRDIAGFDDLDRDLLWHQAKKLSPQELAKKYPTLDAEKLKSLHQELSHD